MGADVGDLVAGKYRIDAVLGRGGMGVVFAATHIELEQRVAVKVPSAEVLEDRVSLARFLREARNSARIRSPHVAQVLDVGWHEGATPYIVMELLEGVDLARLLKDKGALPISEAVDVMLQVAEAIAAAHRLGIVHRDLKPANVFLTTDLDGSTSAKVLDFGIAKVIAHPQDMETALTKASSTIGSPAYMSPEQMKASRDVDARTDLWSMGVILYKLVTGKNPWSASTPLELAARILKDPPTPPSKLRPEVPAALESTILKCLEKEREQRVANVATFAQAIAHLAPRGRDRAEKIARIVGSAETTGDSSVSAAYLPLAGTASIPARDSPVLPQTDHVVAPEHAAKPFVRTERVVVAAAEPARAAVVSAPETSTADAVIAEPTSRAPRARSSAPLAIAGAVVALALVGGVVWKTSRGRGDAPAAPAETMHPPASGPASANELPLAPPTTSVAPASASASTSSTSASSVASVAAPSGKTAAKTTPWKAPGSSTAAASPATAAKPKGTDPWGDW